MNTVNCLSFILKGLILLARVDVQGPEQVLNEIIQTESYTNERRKRKANQGPVGLYQGKYRVLPAGYLENGTDEERYWASFDHYVVSSDGGCLIDGWYLD